MSERIKERIAQIKEHPDKPYFIRYRIEEGRYGKDDAGHNEGLTQDLIYISCITQPTDSCAMKLTFSAQWATRLRRKRLESVEASVAIVRPPGGIPNATLPCPYTKGSASPHV